MMLIMALITKHMVPTSSEDNDDGNDNSSDDEDNNGTDDNDVMIEMGGNDSDGHHVHDSMCDPVQ